MEGPIYIHDAITLHISGIDHKKLTCRDSNRDFRLRTSEKTGSDGGNERAVPQVRNPKQAIPLTL